MPAVFLTEKPSEYVKRPRVEVENERIPFTADEIGLLWKHKSDHMAKIILIDIYTGWRPDELCELTFSEHINIKDMTAQGGKKIEAGKKRIVPFCTKVQPFIKEFYNKGFTHIVCDEDGNPLNYSKYYRAYKDYTNGIGIKHRPHECRHTFATLLDNADINVKIKKLLLGHSSSDVTEKVYTHKTIEQLKEAVEKI